MGSGGSVSYVLQVILQCDFMQTMHSCEPGNSKVDLKSFGTCNKANSPFNHLLIIQNVYSFLISDFMSHRAVNNKTIFSLFTEAANRCVSTLFPQRLGWNKHLFLHIKVLPLNLFPVHSLAYYEGQIWGKTRV